MPKQHAYLVYNYYGGRTSPMCVIIASSIEKAIRKTGGEPLGLFEGKFQVNIPFSICCDSGHRGLGTQNTFVYTNGPIQFEIDPAFFTGGVLTLIEVPLSPQRLS